MMRRIVRSSLRYRFLAIAGALVLVGFGGLQLRDTSVDVFPEFAPPRVEIQTACLGLTAAEVEELITVPLEQNLQGVPDLDVMRSKSVTQLSSIELHLRAGHRPDAARGSWCQERVASMARTLPSWAAPPVMIQPLSATSRVMKIGMSSDDDPDDRPVDDGLLEDPGPPARRTGRGERRDLGTTPRDALRPGRPGAAAQ